MPVSAAPTATPAPPSSEIHHPLFAETLDEIACHLKGAAVDADVLAHQEHPLVALERDGERFADRLGVGELATAHGRALSAGE
jgi:hypothetical protein